MLEHLLRLALVDVDVLRTALKKLNGPDLDVGWLRTSLLELEIKRVEARIAELRSMINAR